MAKQLNVDLRFSADTSQAKKAIQDLQNTLSNLSTLGTQASTNGFTKQIADATIEAHKLKAALNEATNMKTGTIDLSKLQQSLQKTGSSIQQVSNSLINMGPIGQKAFQEFAAAIAQAQVPTLRLNSLFGELWTTLKNVARFQMSSSIIHGLVGGVSSAYHYAQKLDESLNNISIVTGQNADQMARFAREANAAAKSLSSTTLDYTNASLIYYQQGLDEAAVKARTDVTVKLANVSRQSAEEVSNQMTAIWNNFDDGSKSMEYFADVITALGATTASSSQEIAAGLEKFAPIAGTIGLSYEKASAALATIVATTRQSADTVGTGLRTIFSRFDSLKLGETLEDGVDLNKYTKAMQTIGVNVLDANGKLKDMDTILDDVAQKWEKLDKTQKTAFATTVGGVRQYTNLMALFDNWDKVQENMATALNSEGVLNEQAERYAKGWEAARNRVQTALEGLYDTLVDEGAFIKLSNALEKTISFVDNLVRGLGGVHNVLGLIAAIVMKLNQGGLSNLISNVGYNIASITGIGQKQAEQMRTNIVNQAINASLPTGASAVQQAESKAMQNQLKLQQVLNKEAGKYNAIQKQVAQSLVEQQRTYDQIVIDSQKELQSLNNRLTIMKQRKSDLQAQKQTKEIKLQIKSLDQNIADLTNEIAIKEGEVNRQVKDGEASYKNIENSLRNMSTMTMSGSDMFAGLIQGATSAAMALNMFENIVNALADSDMSFGDRLTSSLTSLLFLFPMVSSSVQSFKNIILGSKQIIEDFTLTQQISNAAVSDANLMTNLNSLAKGTNTGTVKINGKEIDKETAKRILNSGAINTENGHLITNTGLKIKNAAASLLSSKAFKIALIAIVALVAVYKVWKKAQEERVKLAQEEAKKNAEEAKAIAEEVKANKELLKSYEEAKKAWKDGTGSKEELAEAAKKVADAYKIENSQLLIATGRYEDLEVAINKARVAEAKEAERSARYALATASQSYAATAGKNGKGYWAGYDGLYRQYQIGLGNGSAFSQIYGDESTVWQALESLEVFNDKTIQGLASIDISTGDLVIKAEKSTAGFKAMYDFMAALVDKTQEIATLDNNLLESEWYKSAVQFLKDQEENYKAIIEAEQLLVDAKLNQTLFNVKTSDIKNLQQYNQLIDQMVESLQKDPNLKLSKEAALEYAEEYANTILPDLAERYEAAKLIKEDDLGRQKFSQWLDSISEVERKFVYNLLIDTGSEEITYDEFQKKFNDQHNKLLSTGRTAQIEDTQELLNKLFEDKLTSADLTDYYKNYINAEWLNIAEELGISYSDLRSASKGTLERYFDQIIAELQKREKEADKDLENNEEENAQEIESPKTPEETLAIAIDKSADINQNLTTTTQDLITLLTDIFGNEKAKGIFTNLADLITKSGIKLTNKDLVKMASDLSNMVENGFGHYGSVDGYLAQIVREKAINQELDKYENNRDLYQSQVNDINKIAQEYPYFASYYQSARDIKASMDIAYDNILSLLNDGKYEEAYEQMRLLQWKQNRFPDISDYFIESFDSTAFIESLLKDIDIDESIKNDVIKRLAPQIGLDYDINAKEYKITDNNGNFYNAEEFNQFLMSQMTSGLPDSKKFDEKYDEVLAEVGLNNLDLLKMIDDYGNVENESLLDRLNAIKVAKTRMSTGKTLNDQLLAYVSYINAIKEFSEWVNEIESKLEQKSQQVEEITEEVTQETTAGQKPKRDFKVEIETALAENNPQAAYNALWDWYNANEELPEEIEQEILEGSTLWNDAMGYQTGSISRDTYIAHIKEVLLRYLSNYFDFAEEQAEQIVDNAVVEAEEELNEANNSGQNLSLGGGPSSNVVSFGGGGKSFSVASTVSRLVPEKEEFAIPTGRNLFFGTDAFPMSTTTNGSETNTKSPLALFSLKNLEPVNNAKAAVDEENEKWNQLYQKLTERFKLDEEAVKSYKEYLEINLKDLNLTDFELTELAAKQMLLEKGIKTLNSEYKNFYDLLKNKRGTQEFANSLATMQSGLKDLINSADLESFNETIFDEQFFEENQEVIKKALEGDLEAFEALQTATAHKIVTTMDLEIPQQEELNAIIDEIQALIPDDITIGTSLDEIEGMDAWTSSLNELMANGQITADQVNKILSSIGFDPEITYKTFTVDNITDAGVDGSSVVTMTDPDGNQVTMTLSGNTREQAASTGQVSLPVINANATRSTTSNLTSSSFNGGGGSGGNKKKEPPKPDRSTRYHRVNKQQDANQRRQQAAQDTVDRTVGSTRIAQLQRQIKLEERSLELSKEKLKEAQEYLKVDKADMEQALKDIGLAAQIGEDGIIDNYQQLALSLFNKEKELVDQYNQGIIDDDKYDEEKQKLDDAKEAMGNYEETIETAQEEAEKLADSILKMLDLQLEKIQYDVEFKVGLDEADLSLVEHLYGKIEDDVYSTAEAIALLGKEQEILLDEAKQYEEEYSKLMQQLQDNVNLYRNMDENSPELQALLQKLGLTYEEWKNLGDEEMTNYLIGADVDNVFSDLTDKMLELDSKMDEIVDKINEKVINAFNELYDKEQQQIDIFDHYTTVLDNLSNIADLTASTVGAATARSIQNIMRDTKITNQNNRLSGSYSLYKQMVDERSKYEQLMAEATTDAQRKLYEDLAEAAREKERETLEQWQSDLTSALETIREKAENTMNEAIENFRNSFYNGFVNEDYFNSIYDKAKDIEDSYVQDYERLYRMSELEHQSNKLLDKLDNPKYRKEVLAFQERVNQYKQAGVKISQNQIDAEQKWLDLIQARIALEDAQNAKSIVRLQRDNEGNWGYVYTNDADEIENAEAEVQKALYEYQKSLDDSNKKILERVQRFNNDYADSMEKLKDNLLAGLITEDEYNAEVARLQELAQQQAAILKEQSDWFYEHFGATHDEMLELYNVDDGHLQSWDETPLARLLGYSTIDEAIAGVQPGIENLAQTTLDAWHQMLDEQNETLNIVDTSVNTLATDMGNWADAVEDASSRNREAVTDLADSFDNVMLESIQAVQAEWDKWLGQLQQTQSELLNLVAIINEYRRTLNFATDNTGNNPVDIPTLEDVLGASQKPDIDYPAIENYLSKENVITEDYFNNILGSKEDLLQSIQDYIKLQAQTASYGFGNITPGIYSNGYETIEQNVHIDANFPNVVNSSEIEEAFENLVNKAAQYANRKRQG